MKTDIPVNEEFSDAEWVGMSPDINGNGAWKWISGLLATVIISNVGTAYWFTPDKADLKAAVAGSFTELSRERSIYALEGRQRLDNLERRISVLESDLVTIRIVTAESNTLLKNLVKRDM